MILLVAVITHDLLGVTQFARTILILVVPLIGLTWLGCIDSGGRDGAFLLPLLLVMLAAVFLLFLSSFCQSL